MLVFGDKSVQFWSMMLTFKSFVVLMSYVSNLGSMMCYNDFYVCLWIDLYSILGFNQIYLHDLPSVRTESSNI